VISRRLPVMLLPSWLRSRTQPVAIDDVVVAIAAALKLTTEGSASFDLPGPQVMSCREILEVAARVMGLPAPRVLDLPLLTPRLSSHWLRLVTRAKWSVAREVVLGLTQDLLARDDAFWRAIGYPTLISVCEAARRAIAAERGEAPALGVCGLVERLRRGAAHPVTS
jgi:uncharacterized protein YbjT (DUF2867 family)